MKDFLLEIFEKSNSLFKFLLEIFEKSNSLFKIDEN